VGYFFRFFAGVFPRFSNGNRSPTPHLDTQSLTKRICPKKTEITKNPNLQALQRTPQRILDGTLTNKHPDPNFLIRIARMPFLPLMDLSRPPHFNTPPPDWPAYGALYLHSLIAFPGFRHLLSPKGPPGSAGPRTQT